jgi:hypothetical protein
MQIRGDAALVLSLTYYEQAFTSLAPSGIFELSRHAAESALKLNPKLGLAHAALGPVEGCVEGAPTARQSMLIVHVQIETGDHAAAAYACESCASPR